MGFGSWQCTVWFGGNHPQRHVDEVMSNDGQDPLVLTGVALIHEEWKICHNAAGVRVIR
jgi:hypothetical protein